jgi:hypothetical protein
VKKPLKLNSVHEFDMTLVTALKRMSKPSRVLGILPRMVHRVIQRRK